MILKSINKDNIAIITDKDEKRTFGDLINTALEYKRMIPKKSLVLLKSDYCLETMEFFFACIYNEYIPIIIDYSYDLEYTDELIKLYRPKFVWCTEKLQDCSVLRKVGSHFLNKTVCSDYPIANELCMLLPTSGSTSNPKMVKLSEKNVWARNMVGVKAYKIDENDRGIVTLPLCHAIGNEFVLFHWMKNATILLTQESVISKEFWEFYEKYNPTVLAGVPYIFELLYRVGMLERRNDNLRMLIQTGGVWNPHIRSEFVKKLGNRVKIIPIYGTTETSRVGALDPYMSECATEYRYSIDSTVAECFIQANTNEIVVKGDSVYMGYAVCEDDLTPDKETVDVHRTGDMGYIDQEGFLHITGRMSRFIKLLGERISLGDIEQCVESLNAGIECGCLNHNDECINVFVAGLKDELAVKRRITKHIKTIDSDMINVILCDTLPRLVIGKIDYRKLAEMVNDM